MADQVDPVVTSAFRFREGNQSGARLGFTVANAGDVNGDGIRDVLVGAPYYDNSWGADAGWFGVFLGTSSGSVSSTAQYSSSGPQAGARLGEDLAGGKDIGGDWASDILVSAPGYDGGQTDEGRVYVLFGGVGSGVTATNLVAIDGNATYRYLGSALTMVDDMTGDGVADFAVGAPNDNTTGRVLVFKGSASGRPGATPWSVIAPPSAVTGMAQFGHAIAAGHLNSWAGGDLVIGAPFAPMGGMTVKVYSQAPNAPFVDDYVDYWGTSGARYGSALAVSGDIDHNGLDEYAVGAPGVDGVHVPDLLWFETEVGTGFGTSVSFGDVNGDGRDDLLVGAPKYSNGESTEGAAFLFGTQVSGTWLSHTPTWIGESNQANAWYGYSVAVIEGIGRAGLVVGAPWYDAGSTDEGAVFWYTATP